MKVHRPYVTLNVAMTADGKIDTAERRGARITSVDNLAPVDRLRAEHGAVLVGGRTLRNEDPKLTVRSSGLRAARQARGLPPNPAKVAITSVANLSQDSDFLSAGPADVYLLTTRKTTPAQVRLLEGTGARVRVVGDRQVDLEAGLRWLADQGIEPLLVEGGATLNAALLRLRLMIEIAIYLAPQVSCRADAPILADGAGLKRDQAIPLCLVSAAPQRDGGVLLHPKVVGAGGEDQAATGRPGVAQLGHRRPEGDAVGRAHPTAWPRWGLGPFAAGEKEHAN